MPRRKLIHRPGRGQRITIKRATAKPRIFQDRNGRWFVEVSTDNRTTVSVDALPEKSLARKGMCLTKPVVPG